MIKNTEWSNDFLTKWYLEGEMILAKKNITNEATFGRSGDQDTLKYLMKQGNTMDHFKILPQCSFNSYPYMRGSWDGVYMKGDFLIHLAGKGTPNIRVLMFEAFRDGHIYQVIDSNKTQT